MFRFLLGFIYVLYILIKSSKSSSVLASFDESCSDDILCVNPLICSNTSKCICSKSASIWDKDQNDCLYCPPGWIEWENNRCLSFSVPSEGGFPYEQANQTCLVLSAQLFYMYNIDEFKLFELRVNNLLKSTVSSAVTIFFRLGAWIDKVNIEGLEDIWCDEKEVDPTYECVFIRRESFKNGSLCLSRSNCNEDMPFICDMAAISEKTKVDNGNSDSSNQRFAQLLASLAPMALDLVGNLLGGNKQQAPPPQPAAPQQIIIQQDPAALAAAHAAQKDNTALYIGFGVGGFILLLFICGAIGGIMYCTVCSKNSPPREENNGRSSVESTLSNA